MCVTESDTVHSPSLAQECHYFSFTYIHTVFFHEWVYSLNSSDQSFMCNNAVSGLFIKENRAHGEDG